MTSHSAGRIALLAALLFGALLNAPVNAQEVSAADIVKALTPKAKVRDLALEQTARETRQSDFVNPLQRERTRGMTLEEKDEIAAVIGEGDLPELDLEVFFATDSAEITAQALPILEMLGNALNDVQLRGSAFLIGGYANAEEADGVSEERADAVRNFLIDKFSIAPERLLAVGFGEVQMKDEDKTLAGEKRRVRVVNMASR